MSVIGNSIEVYKNMAKSATQDSINYKKRIDKAIETIKDEGLVVAIKIINEKNDEALLSSKDLLIDILKGTDDE